MEDSRIEVVLISTIVPLQKLKWRILLVPLLISFGRAETPSTEPPLVLPTVTVQDGRDLPARESWRYAMIPGFEILSNASPSKTKRILRDFQFFREALAQAWSLPAPPAQPALLILCGAKGRYESFLPAVGKTHPHRASASVFLHDHRRAAIVLDCGSSVTGVLSGMGEEGIPVENSRELYRQYVYLLMSRSEPRVPLWFVEGFAQIVRAVEFDRKLVVFGKLPEPRQTVDDRPGMFSLLGAGLSIPNVGGESGGFPSPSDETSFGRENKGFIDLLKRKPLIPLDRFFAVQEGSSEVVASLGSAAIWPQQAYAFVHFCLFGQNGKYQKPLYTFMRRLAHEPPSEPLFKACFGMSYNQMLDRLHSYKNSAYYNYMKYRAKGEGLPVPGEVTWREATPAEVGRIKGDALDLAGYSELAHDYLVAPYVRGEYDAPLLAALGLWERRVGHGTLAPKFLEAAFAASPRLRPEACIELARYRSREALAQPAAAGGKLSVAQVDRIVAPLMVAQSQPPPFSAVYELLADTWLRAQQPPTVEQVEMLIKGAQLFPTRFDLIYDTALLCHAVGLDNPARALVDHGIKFAPNPETGARFAEAKASLR